MSNTRKKQKSANGVYKITLTAIYNNPEVDIESIAEAAAKAFISIGNGVSIVNVDSIKKPSNSSKEMARVLDSISKQGQESMKKDVVNNIEFVSVKNNSQE